MKKTKLYILSFLIFIFSAAIFSTSAQAREMVVYAEKDDIQINLKVLELKENEKENGNHKFQRTKNEPWLKGQCKPVSKIVSLDMQF